MTSNPARQIQFKKPDLTNQAFLNSKIYKKKTLKPAGKSKQVRVFV
jgi:hypothetical protein